MNLDLARRDVENHKIVAVKVVNDRRIYVATALTEDTYKTKRWRRRTKTRRRRRRNTKKNEEGLEGQK
jgi:CBS-domain-containing membrane protein